MSIIKNKYYWEIKDELSIYLPLRRYQLTLTHRMLEQLGVISHLFLNALEQIPEQQGINWVQKLTGLSLEQLYPIFNRLYELGLVNENIQLSPNGETLMYWNKQLHKQSGYIWLDAQHHQHKFFCAGSTPSSVVQLEEDGPFVIRSWHKGDSKPRSWSRLDWNEDCERQKNRIWRYPEYYLSAVFPNFKDCLSHYKFNIRDWELSVRYESSDSFFGLKVPIDIEETKASDENEFIVYSPILCLDTTYELPDEAPQHFAELKPQDQRYELCFSSVIVDTDNMQDVAESTWIWPIMTAELRDAGIRHLFKKIKDTAPLFDESVIFNRQHRLTDYWLPRGFDWSVIEHKLTQLTDVHVIKSRKRYEKR